MEGWKQTDGSDSTLQYGRKINETTWQYRQWLDEFDPIKGQTTPISIEEKLLNWWSEKWVEEKIDLDTYPLDVIQGIVESYGYEIICAEPFQLKGYSVEDSVQLACECIFEYEN